MAQLMRRSGAMWNLLQQLAQRERRAGEIYQRLAGSFADLPSVAAFWREMAADEEIHALILEAAREVFPPTAPPPEVAGWTRKIAEVDALLEQVRAEVGASLSLAEALARAEELERSELNQLTAFLVQRAAREFSRLEFLVLDFHLDRHREKLAMARARFVPPLARPADGNEP